MSSEISDANPGLFGWVPAPARGQGRPAFEWTREKSNKVMVLFASGHKVGTAAIIMGCDAKTFRKVFSREIAVRDQADLVVRSGMMAKLVNLMEGGNVAAAKQLDKMIAAERIRLGSPVLAASPMHKPVGLVKLGKKDTALKAAKDAEGRFSTRPPPSLLFQ